MMFCETPVWIIILCKVDDYNYDNCVFSCHFSSNYSPVDILLLTKETNTGNLLHAFFWVIRRCLKVICQRFGTACLFHLYRWEVWRITAVRLLQYLCGKRSGSKIAWANRKGGDGEGQSRETGCGGQRPMQRPEVCMMEMWHSVGVRRVSHGMVEIKLLCFRWLSPLLKLV
jgi:hypothetical protein